MLLPYKTRKNAKLVRRAEQHKRQRILRYEKTGFWVVGNKKEPSEKDSFIIGLMVVI